MTKRTLAAEIRNKNGSAKKLRRDGRIPAIIYGHGKNHIISVDHIEFNQKYKAIPESTIINISIGKDKYDVLIKDYQEDLIRDKIIHLDFFEIERGKILRTHVPIHFIGNSMGEKEGGIFEMFIHEVEIESLPKDLPEDIEIDKSNLELNHSLHIKDIISPPGVHILNPQEQTICLVEIKKEEEIEVSEEELLEGEEDITEGKEGETVDSTEE